MTCEMYRILVIDDDEVDRMRIRRYLAEGTLSPRPQIDEAKDWAAGRAASCRQRS